MSDANFSDAQSTPQTLTNIFFEPGRTFESLRERPRFLVATLILTLLITAFNFVFIQRIGYENIVRARIESSSRTGDLPADQKDQIIRQQSSPLVKGIAQSVTIIGFPIYFAIGAALYLLGAMALGGTLNYKQSLAVYAYSSFPPIILSMLANFILLFIKSPEDIDIPNSQNGLVHANLGFLVTRTEHPAISALLGAFDVFSFYGLFLAALGLQKVGRVSAGAAWSIVIGFWLIGVLIRVGFASFFG
ncbi:MAG: hypothetical protein NVSMB56_06000 [Pyrinomonadaceae bacterium]